MAVRTYLHVDVFHCGAGVNHIPASTGDGGLKILGMNFVFQTIFLLYDELVEFLTFSLREYK